MARQLRAALLTTDGELRESLQALGRELGVGLAVSGDVAVSVREFGIEHLRALQALAPSFVMVDMDEDAGLALELVRHLSGPELGYPVIAVGRTPSADILLQLLRAGVAEFLAKPVTEEGLRDSLARIQPRLAHAAESAAGGRVLAVYSSKGGAGSTTVATNLAIEIHRATGRRTLLVDLDAELGEISLQLGMQPQFNFVDLVQNFHRLDQGLLSSYIERHSSGIHLLSAPYTPDRAADVTEDQIRNILGYLRGEYEFVVLDVARSFSATTVAAFEQADDALLVATVDLPSLRNFQRALPLLRRVMPQGDRGIRLIVNRYDAGDPITLKDVERTLGVAVYGTLSNDYEAVMTSINSGKPIVLASGKPSAYAKDLRALSARLVGASATQGQRSGLLSRMTSVIRSGRPANAPTNGGKPRG